MVYRPQLNVLEKVPITNDGPPEDSPAWDESDTDIASSLDYEEDKVQRVSELHVGDDSKARGKNPEQDQEEEEGSDWEKLLYSKESEEDVQPPNRPTPGSTVSTESGSSKEPKQLAGFLPKQGKE